MKKIIATVLAMVMALALCTTAFAATQLYDAYTADTGAKAFAGNTLRYEKAVTTGDNKSIAYYWLGTDDTTAYNNEQKLVSVSKAEDADYVLKYAGKDTVAMYLAKIDNAAYEGEATAYTDLGKKCGQFDYKKANSSYTSDTKFYTAIDSDDDETYLFVKGGSVNLLVDGKVIGMTKLGKLSEKVVQHTWVLDAAKMTAKCADCGATAKLYAKYVEVPSGAEAVQIQGMFLVADKTPTKPADGTNSSPKTFDAGIAMYVGMALTSVAGSAVVIGKKKEF